MSEPYRYCRSCSMGLCCDFKTHSFVDINIPILPSQGNWIRCDICFCVYKKKHNRRHIIKCKRENYNICHLCSRFYHNDDHEHRNNCMGSGSWVLKRDARVTS